MQKELEAIKERIKDLYQFALDLSYPGKVNLDTQAMPPAKLNPLFEVHILNDQGKALAKALTGEFHGFLCSIEGMCGAEGREMQIVRTKLEKRCEGSMSWVGRLPSSRAER